MGWVSGTVVFFLAWWTVLFAVLPLGANPDPEAQAVGGWRGAPRRVRVARVLGLTTLATAVIWFGIDWVVRTDMVSFREGPWALPTERAS